MSEPKPFNAVQIQNPDFEVPKGTKGATVGEDGSRLTRRQFIAATAAFVAATAAFDPAFALGAPGGRVGAARAQPEHSPRETLFDGGWLFFRGNVPSAETVDFNDSAWRKLALPHDWSFEDVPGAPQVSEAWTAPAAIWSETPRREPKLAEGEFIVEPTVPPATPGGPPHKIGPFDPEASTGTWAMAWTVGGTGWYRKHFSVADIAPGEIVELRFDGAYHTTDVWLNGVHLGDHDHGHAGFTVDLSPYLRRNADNVVAVRVRNEGFNSRWYNGSGIYRHVWLTRTNAVRVPLWGVFVITPEVSEAQATVRVAVEVENRGSESASVAVTAELRDAKGHSVGTAHSSVDAAPGQPSTAVLDMVVESPRRWSPADPALYSADVSLSVQGEGVDQISTPFGIRTIDCDAQRGLLINGEPIKLKGAGVHDHNGLLGAAAIDRAEIRNVELLKANGFNAVRCAHNLYAPAFLDACDRLGLIVIEETFDVWNVGKFDHDLGARRFKETFRRDITNMVKRDRNRPSIVFWNIGNEIPERNKPAGVETAAAIRKAILELDDTRLLTAALAPMVSGKDAKPSRRGLDVVGYNYMLDKFEPDHAENPETVFMSTEQYPAIIYDAWKKVETYPWLIGDFVWTGIDFLGEVGVGSSQLRRNGEKPPRSVLDFTIYFWDYPFYLAGCGDLDLIGRKRPQSHYRDVVWQRSPLELFVQRPIPTGFHEEVTSWGWHDELESWTWPAAEMLTVRTYSAGDEVRLLLNGAEVGRKRLVPTDKLVAEFEVQYQPGELVAVAYQNGSELARKSLTTAGIPAQLRLRAERTQVAASANDLAYVYAEVCDAEGRLVPDAQVRLSFAVVGPARLLVAGSANPQGIESFRDDSCTTFHGVAQAILAPTGGRGEAIIEVRSTDLASDRLSIAVG